MHRSGPLTFRKALNRKPRAIISQTRTRRAEPGQKKISPRPGDAGFLSSRRCTRGTISLPSPGYEHLRAAAGGGHLTWHNRQQKEARDGFPRRVACGRPGGTRLRRARQSPPGGEQSDVESHAAVDRPQTADLVDFAGKPNRRDFPKPRRPTPSLRGRKSDRSPRTRNRRVAQRVCGAKKAIGVCRPRTARPSPTPGTSCRNRKSSRRWGCRR